MSHSDLAFASATELRQLLRTKAVSAVEVTEAALRQVETYNPRINAVVTLNEQALDDARNLDATGRKAEDMGLLHGLPVGIKDVTPVKGLRTTFGSPLYANYIPDEDALIVQRLRQAGAIIIGKTNTPEFSAGGNTFNEIFGRTRNPWDPRLSAGGSTGGGAAGLATGMISLAEGTDLGGSLRIPASFCGVVGLRASPGLIPIYPADYLWDQFQVEGLMARTAEDLALALQAVAGPSPLSPISQPMSGRDFLRAMTEKSPALKLGYCKDIAGIGIDESVEAVCRKTAFELRQLGHQVDEIELDLSFGRDAFLTFRGYWFVSLLYRHLDQIEEFGVNVANNIKFGLKVTAEDLGKAEQARRKIWELFGEFFSRYDHLLTPCMAIPPFPVEQNYPDAIAGKAMETYVDWIAPTFLLSLSCLPVASVPAGLDTRSLPVGLQIVGKPMAEESVLALAAKIQHARPLGFPGLVSVSTQERL